MMKHLLTSLLILAGCSAFSQDQTTGETGPLKDSTLFVIKDSTIIDGMVVYSIPDEYAQFVGGYAEMKKFIEMNINYPPAGICDGFVNTKVYLRVVVLKDGSIPDVKIMRGASDCDECNNEAVRLVKSMPPWIPAKVNGQPVNSYFNLPVKFHSQ